MKSVVNFNSKNKKEYPCLKRWKNTKLVILFIKKDTGVVVSTDGTGNSLGRYSNEWDEENCSLLKTGDYVTLSND